MYVDGQDTPPEKLITLLFLGEKEEEKEEEKDYRINRLVHDNVLASKDGKFTYTIPDNSPVLKSAFFATRNVLDAVYDDKYLGQAIYFGFGDIGPDGKVDIALERAVSELAEVEVRDAGGKRLPRARVFLFVREASAKGIGTPPHTFLPSEILDTDPDGLLRIGVVRSPKSLFYNLMRLKLM